MLLQYCVEKEFCVSNTWCRLEERRNVITVLCGEGIMMSNTWCRLEERKSVVTVLCGEGIMCVKYMV